MYCIIIGGGIGGVALAAALERVGISYEVHEQAEELREVGASLTLLPSLLEKVFQHPWRDWAVDSAITR